tara:strand:+ start:483 stop:836 length:354 start_codon:yes stop_codon:yes gene_type:complete
MIYNTRKLIAALMNKYEIESKYGIAKLMNVSQRTAANWIDRGTTFDNASAKKAADLLSLDFEFILICMEAERAKKNPATAAAWEHIAEVWNKGKNLAISAGLLLFSVVVSYPASGLF